MDTNNNGKDELPDQSKASNKGRSCKGTLLFLRPQIQGLQSLSASAFLAPSLFLSSSLFSDWFPRNFFIRKLPQSIVAEAETKASKDGRHLTEFRYACAGYSLYLDRITKDHSGREQPELPVCYGLELLVGKRMVQKTPAAAPVSAHIHHKQVKIFPAKLARRYEVTEVTDFDIDDHEVPQTQRQQPTQSAGSLFFNRFTRNADLVASGVTKNIRKVGKYVKGSIYEFLYSYRGRPK